MSTALPFVRKQHLTGALFIAICWCTTLPTIAQTDPTEPRQYKNVVACTPLKAVFGGAIGPELVYQRRSSEQFAWQVKAAYIYSVGALPLTTTNYGGRAGIELKWFTLSSRIPGLYHAFELDGGQLMNSARTELQQGRDHKTYYFDVRRTFATGYVKLGFQKTFGRFFFDIFQGVGIRLMQVDYSPYNSWVLDQWLATDWGSKLLFSMAHASPAWGTYPALALASNIRIGVAF